MLTKLRHMGVESKYSALSFLALIAVVCLHAVHWLAAPLLLGAAEEIQMNHHHMNMTREGSVWMETLMVALFFINLVSMYYAVRQLLLAWDKRSNRTRHTYLCSTVSAIVLLVGIYTTVSI